MNIIINDGDPWHNNSTIFYITRWLYFKSHHNVTTTHRRNQSVFHKVTQIETVKSVVKLFPYPNLIH